MMNNSTISTKQRIPYNDRDNWQEGLHYKYGAKNHLHDVDMYLEHKSGEIAGLVEFKNQYEPIEMYKYNQFINLANKAEIPAYICVGSKQPYTYYYIIPLNKLCKEIPTMDQPRYLSEKNYVKFLHYIKKMNAPEELLNSLSDELPAKENRFKPNMRG